MARGQKLGRLAILIDDTSVGMLFNRSGSSVFVYDGSWLANPNAYPLSISLPLISGEHPARISEAFFWGLLPDNEAILQRIAEDHNTSVRSLMGLLQAIGSECPGAIRILPDLTDTALEAEPEQVIWLSETEIANRLRNLARHPLGRKTTDHGQFSLAGAQPKTAFIRDSSGRYGIPSGRIPTTHIIKPPVSGFDGFVENEHFCLSLAKRLGLSSCATKVEHFGDQIAIVVTRFDRRFMSDGRILRIHQEDFCQAAGIHPDNKYQTLGGPSPETCLALLDSSDRPEIDKTNFILALGYNWIIGGTDGHAKNYSMLHTPNQTRLAPLYDIASATAYPQKYERRDLKMAMKIEQKAEFDQVMGRHWQRLAEKARLDGDYILHRLREIADSAPDHALSVATQCQQEGLEHPILHRLVDAVTHGARACHHQLTL